MVDYVELAESRSDAETSAQAINVVPLALAGPAWHLLAAGGVPKQRVDDDEGVVSILELPQREEHRPAAIPRPFHELRERWVGEAGAVAHVAQDTEDGEGARREIKAAELTLKRLSL